VVIVVVVKRKRDGQLEGEEEKGANEK